MPKRNSSRRAVRAPSRDGAGIASHAGPDLFPIVGIGASAGGLEAFTELIKHLPLDTGMGFVLVQHLDPQHESALPQLLARATRLPVHEVKDNVRVLPNRVYVIPPNTSLTIAQGRLKLNPRIRSRMPVRSIDVFFESLAEDQRERAIGVILSGTATDGTLGLEAIKAEGGITFAQDESARYDSMPRSAVAAGCVDFVLSPKDISQELVRIAKHPYVAGQPHALLTPEDDRAHAAEHEDDTRPLPSGGYGTPRTDAAQARSEIGRGDEPTGAAKGAAANGFKQIMLLLQNHSGVDFSLYKSATVRRRIARRVVLEKQDSLESYAEFLRGNVKELDALYSDVLISVTSFFRNPDAFDVLVRKVFPRLLEQRGDEPLRVWVLGCSTGQEAYSIAMAFVEATEKSSRMRKLQIFATDLNNTLLDKARQGLYARTLAQDISPERLRRFFVEEGGGYRVNKALRDMVVFARQNLISDPPFSRMDLISCRNLLIYLEPDLQRKAIPTFHYALKPQGFLFLGASESIGGFGNLFDAIDKKQKIYAKKPAHAAIHLPLARERSATPPPAARAPSTPPSGTPELMGSFRGEQSAQREADRVTVNQFAPPGVLVSADLQILQFRGTTSAYLQPPKGKATLDVLKMAREDLMLPLRAAINKARKDNKTARKENVRFNRNGASRAVDIEVIPLRNLRERWFLILFEDATPSVVTRAHAKRAPSRGRRDDTGASGGRAATSRRVSDLESELAETRDYLQSVQEQHEVANEELQASYEEVQSANEELQSISEELETSKEELESSNEELMTVNEEIAHRNAEINRANSDLQNLQTSTRMAIVLLGRDLRIRRFTPQAEKQFNLHTTDVGRPISHIRHNLVFDQSDADATATTRSDRMKAAPPRGKPAQRDLDSLAADVIDSIREREHEVKDTDGRWYSLRIHPYLTLDNKVDGAVLVLIDIDAQKRSGFAIAESRDYAEAIVETARDPLLILDADLRVRSANAAFYSQFQITTTEATGRLIYELGNGQWDIPQLRELLEEILPGRTVFNDFEVTHEFEKIGRRTMLLNARALRGIEGQPAGILLGIDDVTEALQSREALGESEERYRTVFAAAPIAIFVCDRDAVIQQYNPRAAKLWGREPAVGVERHFGSTNLWLPDGTLLAQQRSPIAEVLRTGIAKSNVEVQIERPDGSRVPVLVNVAPLSNAQGETTGAITSFIDITEQRETASALQRLSTELVDADRRKNEFLAMLAHELRNPLAPLRNALSIMRRTANDAGGVVQPSLEMMERQVSQLVRLVEDLADISRISRGHVELRREPLDVAGVIQGAVEAAQPLVDSMEQTLNVELPRKPLFVNGDASRLAQAVGNLLSNASKFTNRGGRIDVTVKREDDRAVIRVRDNGVGIAAGDVPRVFDLFMQVDTSTSRSKSGLGIGLSLVKQLVEMHGGTVEVRSEGLGKGSEFAIRLPITAPPPQPARAASSVSPATPSKRRVLVVDDNRDAAESIAALLRLDGHDIRTAFDGPAALDAAAGFRPDVVLLDIGLPNLDGYEVARKMRLEPWGKNVVLVALTGWGQEEDRQRSRDAGFDLHLVKPVDAAGLLEVLAKAPDAGL